MATGLGDTGDASMLDDSLGVLTQSVFQATAKTQQTFEKLVPKLHAFQTKASLFSNHLGGYQRGLASAIRSSSFHLKGALLKSMRLTNGISDEASAKVLHSLISKLAKANASVVKAIENKEMLKFTLDSEPKALSAIAREIQSKTQKSFAVMSVADKIAGSSKSMQAYSKNIVERSERAHLAQASPALHEAVQKIRATMDIEQKIMPYKAVVSRNILPKELTSKLGRSYLATSDAMDHAENALTMTGSARAREIVDLRDQVRSALEKQHDALKIREDVVDNAINNDIVPFNVLVNKVVSKELIPQLKTYSESNRKIIDQVDKNRVQEIMSRLEKQVMKQSSISMLLLPPKRAYDLSDFI